PSFHTTLFEPTSFSASRLPPFLLLLFPLLRLPPCSTLFPYTTLFRSVGDHPVHDAGDPGRVDVPFVRAAERGRDDHLGGGAVPVDRKSTRLNSSHVKISYAVFCLKKKKRINDHERET